MSTVIRHRTSHSITLLLEVLASVWDAVVINMLVAVLIIDMRADFAIGALGKVLVKMLTVVIIGVGMSDDGAMVVEVAVMLDFLFGVLTGWSSAITIAVLPGFDVDVFTDMRYVKVLATVVTDLEFAIPMPLKRSVPACSAPFSR